MEPDKALILADQCISDGDLNGAAYALMEYSEHRRGGGYQPLEVAGSLMAGDQFEYYCTTRLESQRLHVRSANREYVVTLRVRSQVDGCVLAVFQHAYQVRAPSLYEAMIVAKNQARVGNLEVLDVVSTTTP